MIRNYILVKKLKIILLLYYYSSYIDSWEEEIRLTLFFFLTCPTRLSCANLIVIDRRKKNFYSNFSNNDYDYYLGHISTTENKKFMTSSDRNNPTNLSNDHTSSSASSSPANENLVNENKSDDDEDEKDNSFDDEETRVC